VARAAEKETQIQKEGVKQMIFRRAKDGPYWYKFLWHGQLIRASTKQSNAAVARQIEAAKRTELAKAQVGIKPTEPAPTLKQFCDVKIEPYAKPRKSWIWYRSGTRALLKHPVLANTAIDQIRGDKIGSFAAARLAEGLQAGSINSSLRVLRRILRLAVD
jgi:hypothetical protein